MKKNKLLKRRIEMKKNKFKYPPPGESYFQLEYRHLNRPKYCEGCKHIEEHKYESSVSIAFKKQNKWFCKFANKYCYKVFDTKKCEEHLIQNSYDF
jgi:hypothetical protein